MLSCLLRVVSTVLFAALLLAAATPVAGLAQDAPLTLFVFDRPPYYVLKDGAPAGGFLLDMALAVLDRAGIAHTVVEMPPGRILAAFEAREVQACSVGWLRTPERETFARFSDPIYRGNPTGLVVHAKTAQSLPPSPSLKALLGTKLAWGLREGFSYGKAIDDAFLAHPATPVRRFSDSRAMLLLIARQRLDAALVGPEEMSWLLATDPGLAESVRFLPLSDAPPALPRYIMCDRSVSPQVMERINAAIQAFAGTEDYQRLTTFPTSR